MFAATQNFLTSAFCTIAVAATVWLATELAYFLFSPPAPVQPDPVQPDPVPTPVQPDLVPIRPAVAPVTAIALSQAFLTTLPVTQLRAIALARGKKGAGRWKKALLLESLL